jgi:hypothetical protein
MLSSVTFESRSRISDLGKSAFEKCASLQFISIPSSIQTISPSCFEECDNLRSIILEAGCKLSAQSVSELRSKWKVTLM